MTYSKNSLTKNGFNEDDRVEFRKQFYDIKSTVKESIEKINNLKLELKTTKNILKVIKTANESLKQTLNLAAYNIDNLKQYRRQWRAVTSETSHAIGMPKTGHKIGYIQDQFSS